MFDTNRFREPDDLGLVTVSIRATASEHALEQSVAYLIPPNNVINGINLAKLNFLKSRATPMCGLSPSLTAVSLVSLSFHVSTNEIDNALTQFDQKKKMFSAGSYQPLGAPDSESHVRNTRQSIAPGHKLARIYLHTKSFDRLFDFYVRFSIQSRCTRCQYPLTKNLMLQIMH